MAPKVSESPEGVPAVRHRFPWALLLALLMVGAFELFVRSSPKLNRVAFIRRDDGVQLLAVRSQIDGHGSEGIALVGSSQVREGIAMPELNAGLQKAGQPIAANYSVRGARMDVTHAVVTRLLASHPQPKLIVVGVSIRDFLISAPAPGKVEPADELEETPTQDEARSSVFLTPWQFTLWQKGKPPIERYRATRYLPETIRGTITPYYATLRQRDRIRMDLANATGKLVHDLASAIHWNRLTDLYAADLIIEESSPLIGERSLQHLGTNGRRDLIKPAYPIESSMRRALPNYTNGGLLKPNAELFMHLKQLTQEAQTAGVKIMWVELPVAPPLEARLSKKMRAEFDKSMNSLSSDLKAKWYPTSQFNFTPDLGDFCDLQHFNLRGAQRMTENLLSLLNEKKAESVEP